MKLSVHDREVLEFVLGTIFDGGVYAFIDMVDDDDEHREWVDEFRTSWLQMSRQCHELAELMPHNADKYRFQLGEYQRRQEEYLWFKMRSHPWNLLKRDAIEALGAGLEVELLPPDKSAIGNRQSAMTP